MNSEIVFKECSKNDIDSLVKVSQKFYPEHYTHIWKNNDPSYYINLSFTKTAFCKDFNIPNILYFLIEKDKSTLGLLKIRRDEEIQGFSKTNALQLEKIYLLKQSTGLGIGKKGIEFTKDYARSLNKKIIWLDVMTTSPALTFYQKNGFKTISTYDLDYPGLKDRYREMQRMVLPI
ncbi:GNAT family N-acetyltransferase [Aquimarina gracilis]|uniref:GNAT family N-acetyltransferase n=1 Tax=Aquimarina gracilis TaxID=874422 RepID=A0ABU5ZYG6_9FLAO|nr:GNAT family N-acetyltransferase [Aquimarina gracilis]MEB3346943.1 GNAT family N-acetyltransferase [Aquimarina gracilis]